MGMLLRSTECFLGMQPWRIEPAVALPCLPARPSMERCLQVVPVGPTCLRCLPAVGACGVVRAVWCLRCGACGVPRCAVRDAAVRFGARGMRCLRCGACGACGVVRAVQHGVCSAVRCMWCLSGYLQCGTCALQCLQCDAYT